MILWNQHERGIPKGIQVGKDGSSVVLNLPSDFEQIKHYGVDCELHNIEVRNLCLLLKNLYDANFNPFALRMAKTYGIFTLLSEKGLKDLLHQSVDLVWVREYPIACSVF